MSATDDTDGLIRRRELRGVAIITLCEPPYNALHARMIAACHQMLDELGARPRPPALCLTGQGGYFSSGADPEPAEMTPPDEVARLCARIEDWPQPVVAVLSGAALGTGAELALAAHARLATKSARFGLPDIAIGLPPRAGGTQRLTRVCGPDVALKLILSGRAASAEAAHAAGIVDGLISGGDPVAAGHALALRLLGDPDPPKPAGSRRDRLRDGTAGLRQIDEARRALGSHPIEAAARIVDCVEAAFLLPFEAGLEFEAQAFADCRDGAASRALRHLFLAERRISPTLLLADEAGQRQVQDAGKAIVAKLNAAQDRAISWLVSQGRSEADIDATFVSKGFARGPFGSDGAAGRGDPAIWDRISGALLAEGGRQVEAGAAARSSEIDALAVWGLGWPRRLGGPMIAAEIAGLPGRVKSLKGWMLDERVWAPPPPVISAARVAGGFAAVSRG